MSPTIVAALIGYLLGMLAMKAIYALFHGLPRASDADTELVEALEQLRAEEGDCVMIYGEDPWARTVDGPVRVVCTGRWTGWEARSYRGAELLHAVRAAHAARYPQIIEGGYA